ncbi:hypothetical protein G6F70_007456 [Rhizopus microsporus]|uniref:Glycosyltransferase subfamily 4-like N-terminal domain-containing protein n=1 Tax=Rhizopus azygosporus TaxID=86630 RepID=A0A367JNR1_RHIAZ|nr:hypothetical protein G6F71_007409 [Rhizopus microsporus]RCH91582.1 hypothetical protein CU097_012205 [Rhizopus azygosporus]KAG1196423.1 hypothetical protein G6F70_007456 [Rhizopus microsporus]KAG1208160.1 hypothetical protein G6F69_007455 [Rhizopus microsporus]KAG1229381.1 hypothetical protein G6F67_007190 [Rhizopus microsporus]
MRIAIITENFFPKVDGVTRTLARLLEHLSLTGHQAIVLGPETNMKSYANAELVGTFGIPFFAYPELKLNFWRPGLTQKLLEFQPDVIHLVDPVFLGAFGLAVVRYYLPHVPIVSSYHTNLAVYCDHFGYGFFSSIMWKWNHYCHSFSQYVACPSPSTRSILYQHGFEHVRLWPRGVDISLFSTSRRSDQLRSKWTEDKDKIVILYVGRLSYEKNIHLVLDAYQHMDHKTCHLVLVGHGPSFHDIEKRCVSSNIPVTLTGYLQGKELAEAYASADVFAFPSSTETFGQVVLEAMASGLPVVGLNAEGVRDLVDHGSTGLLLDTTNLSLEQQKKGYQGLLEKVTGDKKLLKRMSEKAVKKAAEYTWYEAMERMVQLYDASISAPEEIVTDERSPLLSHHKKLMYDSGDSGVEEDFCIDEALVKE